MLGEWGSYEFTRGIAPDERIKAYRPAYNIIASGVNEYKSNWDAQKEQIAEICQEFYDWYLAD